MIDININPEIKVILMVPPIDFWDESWIPLFKSKNPFTAPKASMTWDFFKLFYDFLRKLNIKYNCPEIRYCEIYCSTDFQESGFFAIGIKCEQNGTTYIGIAEDIPFDSTYKDKWGLHLRLNRDEFLNMEALFGVDPLDNPIVDIIYHYIMLE